MYLGYSIHKNKIFIYYAFKHEIKPCFHAKGGFIKIRFLVNFYEV